jgi:hypothetical protein
MHMAKKKLTSKPQTLATYTARAEDLKILGYVEAASGKEALKKARQRYGAVSVERREPVAGERVETQPDSPMETAVPAPKAKTAQGKRRRGNRAQVLGTSTTPPATGTSPEANGTPTATPRGGAGRSEAKPKERSALDAAAQVLAEAGTALSCQEMIAAMAEKGYWTSPQGRTPAATLYSAILRELKTKGAAARIRKTDRGRFARTPSP